MWKYGSKNIQEHKSWIDNDGITHPSNWHIWSVDEKEAAGLVEVTPETPPDSRLYTWGYQADGVTISATAKAMDDVGSGDDLVAGVKSSLTGEVKAQQGSLLAQTDWAVTRKSEKTTAIPSNIATYRDAIRAKATEMEAAITGAADTDAVAALFLTNTLEDDGSTTQSGILFDWPELEK